MGSATVTQMNVRIDASLKTAGDEALSSIGFSPTQAVRALWERAAQRGEQLEAVKRFLNDGTAEASRNPKLDVLEAGWRIVPEGLAALGISESSFTNDPLNELDASALREAAHLERARQKGWL